MIRAARSFAYLVAAAAVVLPGHPAWSRLDPEDQKLIDQASCEEIVREYRNYTAAEKELADRLQRAKAGMAAANIAGIAAFATLGFGFVMWDDNSDAEEALAEVREIRAAIVEGARKKACPL
jgi:TRAP-type C4-dicarboxylate transport system substrate-binding protein